MRKRSPDDSNFDLFEKENPGLLSAEQAEQKAFLYRPLKHCLWTEHKAKLIERYLYGFVQITHHGTYIDGFAGAQYVDRQDSWAAKRVLESRPRHLQHFYLCELDDGKVLELNKLWSEQPPREKKEPKRTCEILPGDFNKNIDLILSRGAIKPNEATFALLDQRTFECHWSTVKKLAEHKQSGNKIELFYFLAMKWLHRALGGKHKNTHEVDAWWGREDWISIKRAKQIDTAIAVTNRIKSEFGYRYVTPFPIKEKEAGTGATMYYMIHATDHPAAPGLMWRAYDQAIRPATAPKQEEMFPLVGR